MNVAQPGGAGQSEPGPEAQTASQNRTCPGCGGSLDGPVFNRFRVCDRCGHHLPVGARQRLEQLLDPESFQETDAELGSGDPLAFADRVPYRDRLAEARRRTNLHEAVVTGVGRIDGREAVLIVFDFGFLGGSMGSAVGEKVARALELADERRLPAIAIPTSGGARMQEGMLALVQMAKTAAAAMRLHQGRQPLITVLADPTTGGVFASFAAQGDIILAEPGARIGFAGPRVVEQITGQTPPPGSQTAEFLFAHGLIDGVVDRRQLRGTLAVLLQLLERRSTQSTLPRVAPYRPAPQPPTSAWDVVELSRRADRPSGLDYVRRLLTHFVELHGDRLLGDDPALVAGMGELEGVPVVVLAQERSRNGGRMRPEGYRKAARLLRLATEFRLPVLTLIDTPGACLDHEAEAHGLALHISNCLAYMSALPVPVISAVIGEGGSGGALALGVADRVLMQEHAIYSVIAPEGAAAILYHDAARARELADALKLTAYDCKLLGVVDTVVPEPAGGAHVDPDYAALLLKQHLVAALAELRRRSATRLVEERYRKFRRMGRLEMEDGTRASEVVALQRRFARALDALRERLPWPDTGARGQAAEEPAAQPDAATP